MQAKKNKHAVALGKKGGSVKSERKTEANKKHGFTSENNPRKRKDFTPSA
jgi:hypothetical protein